MDAEELFDFAIRRHRVEIFHDREMRHDSFLTVYPTGCLLSVRAGLEPAARREAVAVQIARLMLGHVRYRSGWNRRLRSRADYLEALKYASKALIDDAFLHLAEKEKWPVWMLAEEAQVPYRLALVRMADWLAQKNGVSFFTYVPDIRVLTLDDACYDAQFSF